MVLKLYYLEDGPPSLSCRQVLEALQPMPFELVNVSFYHGEHMTEEFGKMNPQKEIPVLEDDGFFLSESVAIMQYICDKFQPDNRLYPKDPKARAIVNHRLLFNLTTYYHDLVTYTIMPIYFDYERTPDGLKRVHRALDLFDTYLQRLGTSHAAADHLTIADFPLVNSTMLLEVIDFDFSQYKHVTKWYNDFKKNHPASWKVSEEAMTLIKRCAANLPDLSHLNHPLHPARSIKK
uniref:Glutathione S-transferase n=1 Tax=Heliothis virescens TaxID=7102 RepID=A0A2A4J7E4_HELVI